MIGTQTISQKIKNTLSTRRLVIYPCNNPEGLSDVKGVHVICDGQAFTHELGGDTAGGLDDLQPTQHVTLGVGQSLALFQGN